MGIIILGSPFWGFSDSLCYNLIHGAWTDALVVGPPAQDLDSGYFLSISCPLTQEFGYMGWTWMKQATLWTVRKDRKIKGFPQTHENKLGT
jgi:hypothetical protein